MIDVKNSRSYSIQDRNSIQNSILSSINILNKEVDNDSANRLKGVVEK